MSHLDAGRLGAAEHTADERAHLAGCARCRVDVQRAREFFDEVEEEPPAAPASEDPYEDLGLIGFGGMGEVRRVRDRRLDRVVAMKLVRRSGEGTGADLDVTSADSRVLLEGELVRRFLREAHVTARLQHPSIVPVHELGRRGDRVFYTMKLVNGRTLAAALLERAPPRLDLVPAFAAICHALAYAHANGVVHRDLKPQNVMLGEFGEAVVLDWGLARVDGVEDEASGGASAADHGLTRVGAVMGTTGYMSPEQATGDPVDPRTDVFALGVILGELLVRGSTEAVGGVPADLAAIAAKARAPAREDRYPDAGALAADVDAWRDGRWVAAHSYSTRELVRRFASQHRAAVGVGLVAGLALAVGGTGATLEVIAERDAALEAERVATARTYWTSMQNRQLEGRPEEAFALLRAAVALGPDADRFRGYAAASGLVRAGGLIRLLRGQEDFGSILALSPDGTHLAAGVGNGTIVWFDVATGRPELTLRGPAEFVWYVAISPDGGHLAAATGGCHLQVWTLADGAAEWTAPCGADRPKALAWSDDGERLAVSGTDTVWVHAADGRRLAEHAGAGAEGVRFLPGSGDLLVAHPEGAAVVPADGGPPRRVLRGIGRAITVAVDPNGYGHAATDGVAVVAWDADGALVRSVTPDPPPEGVKAGRTGWWMGWGSMGSAAGVVALPDGLPQRIPQENQRALWTTFHPTRPLVLTGTIESHLVLWDAGHAAPLASYATLGGRWFRGLVWGLDGRWFAYSGGTNDVAVVTPFLGEPPVPFPVGLRPGGRVGDAYVVGPRRFALPSGRELPSLVDTDEIVAQTGDGGLVAWQQQAAIVHVHDAETGALRWSDAWPRKVFLRGVSRSAAGLLAIHGFDAVVRILDERDGHVVRELPHDGEVSAAGWTPSGELVVATVGGAVVWWGADGTRLATADLGERVERLEVGDGTLALVSGDSRTAVVDRDGRLRAVDVPASPAGSTAQAWSSTLAGPWLAVAAETGPRLLRLPDLAPGPPLEASPAPLVAVGISDDRQRVHGVTAYGTLAWDVHTGAILGVVTAEVSPPAGPGLGAQWAPVELLDAAWFERASRLNGYAVCRDTGEVVAVDVPGAVWADPAACAR